MRQTDLRIALPRRLEQKPPYEGYPQTANAGATKEPENTKRDEAEGDLPWPALAAACVERFPDRQSSTR